MPSVNQLTSSFQQQTITVDKPCAYNSRDAWHSAKAFDVGRQTAACSSAVTNNRIDQRTSCAAAEGLLLQPVTHKDRKPDGNVVRLDYGSSQISHSLDRVEDETKGRVLEAHGIVGRA